MKFKTYINPDGLRIYIPMSVMSEIRTQVIQFYPNECGGILVGSVQKTEETAMIERMILPTVVKSNQVFFRRFANFLNSMLDKIFEQSAGEQFYLGEWHSHPNGPPTPSFTDLSTMSKISQNQNTRMQTPLLLIVSYNGAKFDERFFIFYKDKLIPYENFE